MNWRLINSDVIEGLRQLPDASVHCVVTSPPYYGLRDYDIEGQIGLEPNAEEYILKLISVFAEVRRVLRPDGTLWVNIGDSYANDTKWGGKSGNLNAHSAHGQYQGQRAKRRTGLPPKSLMMIPARFAIGMQRADWILRSDIIWSKPNPMTESVEDRPTKAHEYIYLFAKRARYFYDNEAIKEPNASPEQLAHNLRYAKVYENHTNGAAANGQPGNVNNIGIHSRPGGIGRNRRSVWTIPTRSNPEAHFATYPKALPEICIKAGTSEKGACTECGAPWRRLVEKAMTAHDGETKSEYAKGSTANRLAKLRQAARARGEEYVNVTKTIGWKPTCKCVDAGNPVDCTVLDPFAGTSTTGVAALMLGRRFIGIELNPKYVEMSYCQLSATTRQAVGDLFLPLQHQETQQELFTEAQ